MNGITFLIRARNEENFLEKNILSLNSIKIPFEVVVVLHKCQDNSELIIDKLNSSNKLKFKVNKYIYNKDISRAGYETLVTPSKHENSLITYYDYCFSLSKYKWKFKWDADFFMSDNLAKFINNLDLNVDKPIKYRIGCKLGEESSLNKEIYLSNCLDQFGKYMFWEVPLFPINSEEIALDDSIYIQSISNRFLKKYWTEKPWFLESDKEISNRYFNLINLIGEEPKGLARASNPECEKYMRYIKEYEEKLFKEYNISLYN